MLRATGNDLLEQMESVIAAALLVRDRFAHSGGAGMARPAPPGAVEAIARQDPGHGCSGVSEIAGGERHRHPRREH